MGTECGFSNPQCLRRGGLECPPSQNPATNRGSGDFLAPSDRSVETALDSGLVLEPESDLEAALGWERCGDGSAAGSDAALDYRKSESGAACAALAGCFRPVKRFKDFGKRFGRNAGAAVGHNQIQSLVRSGPGLNPDGAGGAGVADCVANDIGQSALERSPECPKTGGVGNSDFELGLRGFACSHFEGQSPEVDGLGIRCGSGFSPGKGKHFFDEPCHVLQFAVEFVQVGFLIVRSALFNHSQCPLHARNRGTQFMGDVCCKPALPGDVIAELLRHGVHRSSQFTKFVPAVLWNPGIESAFCNSAGRFVELTDGPGDPAHNRQPYQSGYPKSRSRKTCPRKRIQKQAVAGQGFGCQKEGVWSGFRSRAVPEPDPDSKPVPRGLAGSEKK